MTCTCNEVHLWGNFRNVTKYQYRRFKLFKVIQFPLSIAICVFILYFKYCCITRQSLFYKSSRESLIYVDWIQLTSAKRDRARFIRRCCKPIIKAKKVAAVAAVTTSCQVSQANVGRLIIGFLSEGLLLLLSQNSNLSRYRRSKPN